MVQWFKNLIAFLFHGPTRTDHLISFNKDALCHELERELDRLYEHRHSEAFKSFHRIIEIAHNVEILSINAVNGRESRELCVAVAQGRRMGVRDLYANIDRAMNTRAAEREKGKREKESRDQRKVADISRFSRQPRSAGPAI